MKVTVLFDGGPLDGSFTFDDYNPANLNKTGLALGSNEFHAWMMFDGAFCFGKGQIGYVSGGMSPASMQRRLAGETNFQAGPCNYELVEWEEKDGAISAKFRHIDWQEVLRFRATRSVKGKLTDLKAKLESEREHLKKNKGVVAFSESGPTSMGLMEAVVAVIEAQQRQIDLLEKRLDEHGHPIGS